jgi:hypothetical protein
MSSMDDLPPQTVPESEPAEYVTFLEHWATEFPVPTDVMEERDSIPDARGSEPRRSATEPPPIPVPNPSSPPVPPPAGTAGVTGQAGPALLALGSPPPRLPRRRDETESLRVHLAPEQLYWVRLAAARAGTKVDESALVAAGLALLEQRAIDWRRIRSRGDLRAALVPSPAPPPAEP